MRTRIAAHGRTTVKHIVVKLLALIAFLCPMTTTARAESFVERVDIGDRPGGPHLDQTFSRSDPARTQGLGTSAAFSRGRSTTTSRRRRPTVLLISGTDTARKRAGRQSSLTRLNLTKSDIGWSITVHSSRSKIVLDFSAKWFPARSKCREA